MHRKLTIPLEHAVYEGLHRKVGRGQISRDIEDLVCSHVVEADALEADALEALYRLAAEDATLEAEALAWIEAAPHEVLECDAGRRGQ